MALLSNPVVGSYGQDLLLNINIDFTGYETIYVKIRKPNGDVVELDSDSDPVTDNGDATAGIVKYVIEAGIHSVAGVYRAHVKIFKTGQYMKISNPTAKWTVSEEFES